jgi:hypothetical protein
MRILKLDMRERDMEERKPRAGARMIAVIKSAGTATPLFILSSQLLSGALLILFSEPMSNTVIV